MGWRIPGAGTGTRRGRWYRSCPISREESISISSGQLGKVSNAAEPTLSSFINRLRRRSTSSRSTVISVSRRVTYHPGRERNKQFEVETILSKSCVVPTEPRRRCTLCMAAALGSVGWSIAGRRRGEMAEMR